MNHLISEIKLEGNEMVTFAWDQRGWWSIKVKTGGIDGIPWIAYKFDEAGWRDLTDQAIGLVEAQRKFRESLKANAIRPEWV